MSEKVVRTQNGKLVLLAWREVGINSNCSFAHMHGLEKNGFPKGRPDQNELSAKKALQMLLMLDS